MCKKRYAVRLFNVKELLPAKRPVNNFPVEVNNGYSTDLDDDEPDKAP